MKSRLVTRHKLLIRAFEQPVLRQREQSARHISLSGTNRREGGMQTQLVSALKALVSRSTCQVCSHKSLVRRFRSLVSWHIRLIQPRTLYYAGRLRSI